MVRWIGYHFPGSSASKESAFNAGDPSLIPGSGRSSGEGIGYSCQNFLSFPGGSVGKESACNVEDLGSIPGLGRSLEEGMATHSSILAWRIPRTEEPWQATVHGVTESDTTEQLSLFSFVGVGVILPL